MRRHRRKTIVGVMFPMRPAQVFASYQQSHRDYIVVATPQLLVRASVPVRRPRRLVPSFGRDASRDPRPVPS